MLDRLAFFIGNSLPMTGVAWAGYAAACYGLRRLGYTIKFPLWVVFLVLWVVITLAGFVGGTQTTNVISTIAILLLVGGIVVYLISFPAGRKRKTPSENCDGR